MFPVFQSVYKIIVIVDKSSNQIIGAGSLMLEKKFVRDVGLCAHVEDIVVN